MLTAERIRELFSLLNIELAKSVIQGELYLAGGAAMCLAFHAREATKDVDALLVPQTEIREAARTIAISENLPADWLNDAVKGYFSATARFEVFEKLSNLLVYVPHPEYLLAMKCLAMRLGEEFQDLSDVGVLVRTLGIRTASEAEAILAQYYPIDRYPVRARYALEELISGADSDKT